MNWIFQGSPRRFDIDAYLSRYSFIYWTANQLVDHMRIDDPVFIWRAGKQSGIIAKGKIAELPKERSNVTKREALGGELWTAQEDEPSTIKVGIKVFEARLTPQEGMILRNDIKNHPKFSSANIITAPEGTVFRLRDSELKFLNTLWNYETVEADEMTNNLPVYEGAKALQMHYRRERNNKIINDKKYQFKQEHGKVFCEVCFFDFKEKYPHDLAEDFIEVHHLIPISKATEQVKTTMDDLILICPNCHRMVHRTKDVDRNLKILKAHFKQKV